MEEDEIASLAKCMKPSVITGMRVRKTEQIFALNAFQDRGIATDMIFTFNVTASDSLTDLADVYWPLNHSSRMLALFPNLKSLNVKGFVIPHTLLLLETVIFKDPAGERRQLITRQGLGSDFLHSGLVRGRLSK